MRNTLGMLVVAGLAGQAMGQCVAQWVHVTTPVHPPASSYGGMAFDSRRGVSVLFGGEDSTTALLGQTWELGGSPFPQTWTQRTTASAPDARSGCMMAYDSARGVTVLFGGGVASIPWGYYGDTWEYDGTNWTHRQTAHSPTERALGGMAYDSARHVCVLFGGSTGNIVPLGDTWEYDGTDWVQRNPTISPATRIAPCLAYDGSRGVCVLVGGWRNGGSGSGLETVWEWNGSIWGARLPGTAVAPNYQEARTAQMVYDNFRHVCVMHPRYYQTGENRMYEWDGAQWTMQTPLIAPGAVYNGVAMVFDEGHGMPVLFGGLQSDPVSYDETWVWMSAGVQIAGQPQDQQVSPGQPVQLTVSGGGQAPVMFRWRKGGAPLADGNGILGSASPTLQIANATAATTGAYDCIVSGPCGAPVTSNPAVVIVGGGANTCYANCDASTTAPVLNVNDFICFLNKFSAGCP